MLVKIKMRLDIISQKEHIEPPEQWNAEANEILRSSQGQTFKSWYQVQTEKSENIDLESYQCDTWDFFRLCEKSLSFIAVPIFICSFLSWRNPAAGRTNQSMAAMAACGWQGPTWAQGAGPFRLRCRLTKCGRRTRSARSESLRWTGFRATTTTTCWCRTCRICRRNRIRSSFLREPAEKVKVTKKTFCF